MAECEKIKLCPFFNDKMSAMPATANIFKNNYCRGDNSKCARFIVAGKLGAAGVPADLYPNQMERAEELTAAI